MSYSKLSRNDRKKKNQTQNQILVCFGCAVVIATSIFSIMGTKLAVNNINRDAQDAIVYAQQYQHQKLNESVTGSSVVAATDTIIDETKQWSDEQVKWMQENHITYNEHGQPVDENGNVVTDPTVSDVQKSSTKSSSSTETTSDTTDDVTSEIMTDSSDEPETNTNWASDKDWLTQSDDGNYFYVVQSGDVLSRICKNAGFSLDEVVKYNNIKNPDMLHVGDVVNFPQSGPAGTGVNNTNLGLG